MQNIILKSNKNLQARLWLPKNAKKGIVIMPSFRNTFEQPVCLEAARGFYNKGYAVLAFNFVGHGESEGGLKDVSLRAVSENVSSAIRFLRDKGIEKVGVYTVSLGTIASVLSEERPDAQFLISPSPLYNPKSLLQSYSKYIDGKEEELEKNGYVVVMSGSGRGDFKMGKEWIDEMRDGKWKVKERYMKDKTPTLIVQGTSDKPSRLVRTEDFIKSTGSEYFPIVGGDHSLSNPKHRKIAIEKALEFFSENL